MATPNDDADDQLMDQLMYDVVTTLTANARRVGELAVREAEVDGADPVGRVATALATETEGIVAGIDPANVELVRAVEAAGRAITAVAVQALRTGVQPSAESLDRAFDLFSSYLTGPGRSRILDPS